MPETIGQRVRRLREERGFTCTQLALDIGFSETALRHVENGRSRAPSAAVTLRLADKLGVDPYYLVFGEGRGITDQLLMLSRRLEAIEKRVTRIEGNR